MDRTWTSKNICPFSAAVYNWAGTKRRAVVLMQSLRCVCVCVAERPGLHCGHRLQGSALWDVEDLWVQDALNFLCVCACVCARVWGWGNSACPVCVCVCPHSLWWALALIIMTEGFLYTHMNWVSRRRSGIFVVQYSYRMHNVLLCNCLSLFLLHTHAEIHALAPSCLFIVFMCTHLNLLLGHSNTPVLFDF